jgi:hypothetical protein
MAASRSRSLSAPGAWDLPTALALVLFARALRSNLDTSAACDLTLERVKLLADMIRGIVAGRGADADPVEQHLDGPGSSRSGTSSTPAEQARIVQLLVERVDVREEALEVRIRAEGLVSLVGELRQQGERMVA